MRKVLDAAKALRLPSNAMLLTLWTTVFRPEHLRYTMKDRPTALLVED
jgi:hypothetical protein